MAKIRKTKKEKLRSAKRQTPETTVHPNPTAHSSSESSLYTYIPETTSHAQIQHASMSEQMLHLRHDLLRTFVVTGAIILAELSLYFMLLSR